MKKFGIISEGVTDQITIENILCGFFANIDDDDIQYLQPPFSESDKKQQGFSNWLITLNYLKMEGFRNDVLSCNFVIIQIDTDVSNETHFNVSHFDDKNQELTPEALITNVVEKLIAIIDSGESGFYQYYSEKIIFCISVHSLECWLYAYHNNKPRNKAKIKGCFEELCRLPSFDRTLIEKNYACYNKLSQPFSKRKNIDMVTKKDPSFNLFIQQLQNIVID